MCVRMSVHPCLYLYGVCACVCLCVCEGKLALLFQQPCCACFVLPARGRCASASACVQCTEPPQRSKNGCVGGGAAVLKLLCSSCCAQAADDEG